MKRPRQSKSRWVVWPNAVICTLTLRPTLIATLIATLTALVPAGAPAAPRSPVPGSSKAAGTTKVAALPAPVPGSSAAVDFATQVRPILSKHCFACHGPDKNHRKGGLRLDTRDGAFKDLGGYQAIVPGDATASELVVRILATDPDDRMPPPDDGAALSAAEIALVRRWVEQGATWRGHWSFEPPQASPVPPSPWPDHAKNPVDNLVHARLAQQGIAPSSEADPVTLIRRLSLDLTGLPPSPADVRRFVSKPTEDAYRQLVDKYLASPAYGERWASMWLDLARYADSRGYEKDTIRTIWRYRDWVIQALNADMPYARFGTLQLAGDLLPDADDSARLATAFHRNTLTNDEAGTSNEEFRIAAVKDRVDTTMQVFMGITAGCARCHDHKYDPLTQREYYELFAFFDQTEDADRGDDSPHSPFPTSEQQEQLAKLQAARASIYRSIAREVVGDRKHNQAWQRSFAQQATPEIRQAARAGKLTPADWGSMRKLGPFVTPKGATPLDAAYGPEAEPGKVDFQAKYQNGQLGWAAMGGRDGDPIRLKDERPAVTFFARKVSLASPRAIGFAAGADNELSAWLDGAPIATAQRSFAIERHLAAGEHVLLVKVASKAEPSSWYFRRTADHAAGVPVDVANVLMTAAQRRSPADRQIIDEYYARTFLPSAGPLAIALDANAAETQALRDEFPLIPIMRELPADQRRETHVHVRGNFLDTGDVVTPAPPQALHPWPNDAPRTRLGLARWIFADNNTLTARVAVNRHWARFFGLGLVETEEDFGAQGMPPTQPELLDWLARNFLEQGGSLKQLCRTIVMSATYRQSARVTPVLATRDPRNLLLARGPRVRIESEMIRDNALFVSGLLTEKLYGPSVMPPQPDGIWRTVYSTVQWKTSPGADRYRRGLYTFLRRTSPYPQQLAFDATSRELCTARRIRSNTPLQALVTLNDPVFVEAAQALAKRVLSEIDGGIEQRIDHAFFLSLGRQPTKQEMLPLVALYRDRLTHYQAHAAEAALMAGEAGKPDQSDKPDQSANRATAERAALATVANVILNLDEFLTKG